MHVMVLGAGVTGVTTAWYLLEAGFEVSVIERRGGPALETSFANGGQISISHPEPWSSPAAPMIALKSLVQRNAPLRVGFGTDLERWRWLLAFLRECLPARHRRNAHAIATLAVHSGNCLRRLRERTGIDYEHTQRGILHLFHSRSELAQLDEKVAFLTGHGIRARVTSPQQCAEIEPALASIAPRLAGALYAPDDESGDARQFTERLAQLAVRHGVRFHFETTIDRLVHRNGDIAGVEASTANGERVLLQADSYVSCLGSRGARLLAELRPRLPIYPVKGYSVTVPVVRADKAPTVSLTDESRRIVCSRLGERLRVAGTAEIAGFDDSIQAERCQPLLAWIDELFPSATRTDQAELWAGLRPCTPSYVPVIGRSNYRNLWLNTGHGSLGWTLSCGSAQLISRLLAGAPNPLPAFPLWRPAPR